MAGNSPTCHGGFCRKINERSRRFSSKPCLSTGWYFMIIIVFSLKWPTGAVIGTIFSGNIAIRKLPFIVIFLIDLPNYHSIAMLNYQRVIWPNLFWWISVKSVSEMKRCQHSNGFRWTWTWMLFSLAWLVYKGCLSKCCLEVDNIKQPW